MTTTSQPTTSPTEQESLPFLAACIDADSWTDAVRAAASHLAKTVGPVLAIARIESGTVTLTPVGTSVDDAKQTLMAEAAGRVFRRAEGWFASVDAFAVRSVVTSGDGSAPEALVGLVTVSPSVPHLTAASAALSAVSAKVLARRRVEQADVAGIVVDLVDRLHDSCTQDELDRELAVTFRELVGAEMVAIAHRRGDRFEVESVEPSGMLSAAERVTVAAACDEIHVLGQPLAWPPFQLVDRPARRAVQAAAELGGRSAAWGIPLEDSRGRIETIVFAWAPDTVESLEGVVAYCTPTVGSTIRICTTAQASWWQRLRSVAAEAVSGRLLRLTSIAAFTALVILAIPMPYDAKCDCRLAPSLRRFVAAPFAATLETVAVKPGDVVAEGSVLAELDEREIEYELTGIEAEFKQAQKRGNAALASGNLAESQIADHDRDRLMARRDLLESRRSRLAIKAPLAGVVVDGDLTRAEGVPLELGQSLFEIAPLDKFVCEVHVPEFDANLIAVGQTATIVLDARPGDVIKGTVGRIRPRAETWDDAIGFVVEVEVENVDGTLRPGMTGDAKVRTTSHPLGWNLFHRAYGKWRRGW